MRNRMAALLLALALVLSGCSLQQENLLGVLPQDEAEPENVPAAQEVDTLRIAYNSDDPLEPYQAQSTMNLIVVPLLYDSLVKLDQEYVPHNVVARDIQLTAEQCVVAIRTGLVFSDGTPLTAADVVYSAQQTQAEGNAYSGLLSNVTQISARDDETVVFTLASPDRLFANLLTFPIVSVKAPGRGSGRYVLQNAGGSEPYLAINPRWYGQNSGTIKTIRLINQLDKDTLIYSLKLGTINYVYSDLSSDESTLQGVSTQSVPLNNLVYLGVNSTKRTLSSAQMRRCISLIIDRENLVDETFANGASPAVAPFNPASREVRELELAQKQDFIAAAALMEELGYQAEKKDSEGYYVTGQGRLRLRLLVNSDNAGRMQIAGELQKSFKELGIELAIDARTFEKYKEALSNWDFDLYLGEVKLYNNMDLTKLLSPMQSLGFGLTEDAELVALHESLRAGATDLRTFVEGFNASLPFIPLMYRNGIVSFSREVYFDSGATEQDIFYDIETW